ncbi:excalibur calcium-binding domain-containing protein [Streptomyces erythrochromogenes]|uniref:excalibur calcium-binding domain-containing protein n=1 Tax=Streptomyces erythrochromogenes TaxID=285574 RepID=UPI0036B6AED8
MRRTAIGAPLRPGGRWCTLGQGAGGPWWLRRTRGIRRWWACRSLPARIGLFIGAGFAALVVLGAVSGESRTTPEVPGSPPTPASRTPSEAPVVSTASTAPKPARTVPVAPPPRPSVSRQPPTSSEPVERPVHYDNCDDARAAGAAPLVRGGNGYRDALDRDSDGVACEPYFGR